MPQSDQSQPVSWERVSANLRMAQAVEPIAAPNAYPDAQWCGAIDYKGQVSHVFTAIDTTFTNGGTRVVVLVRANGKKAVGCTLDMARKSKVEGICYAAQLVDLRLSEVAS